MTMSSAEQRRQEAFGNAPFKNKVYDGFVLTEYYEQFKHVLDNWEVYDEDVWIAGMPKSGTTWTQEMVWLVVNNLDYEGAKISIQERTPHWEDSTLLDIRPVGIEKNVEIPLFRADSLKFIQQNKKTGKPMCIKTHMPFNFLPNQIKDGSRKPKIVYVARNPKDSVVSYYYYLKSLVGLDMSMEDFAKTYLLGDVAYGPIWEHTISYWNKKHLPNLLIITFEEMVEDLPKVIKKVCKFLGKEYTEEELKQLANHLSFQSMKHNPAVNFTNLFELFKKLGLNSGSTEFLRSGKVGTHKAELSPELIKQYDQKGLEMSKISGWNFV